MAEGWGVLLNDVYISCGEEPPECLGPEVRSLGFLNAPPEGLGVPGIRTEDITYPQRDGVRMFSDWYEPRQITLSVSVTEADVPCGADGLPCITVREAVARIMKAWSRHCDNTELVIFTDCTGQGETVLISESVNLFANPSGEVTTDGWAAVNGSLAPIQLFDAAAPQGTYVIRTERAAGTSDNLAGAYTLTLPVAGVYTLTASVRGSSQPGLRIEGSGVVATQETYFTTNPTQWHAATLTFEWDGTGEAVLYARNQVAATDFTLDIDGLTLVQGNDPALFFDGDTADTDTVTNTWDGTPGLSTSTRRVYTVDNALVGPYGVTGRPRQAQLTWAASGGYIADIVLRFDAIDQNMYVLDECGTPGSGVKEIELGPGTSTTCTPMPICFGQREVETYTFTWEARSYMVDGINYVEIWVTEGTFPEGNYQHSGTGFPLVWDGVPPEPTWDTLDPVITWDSLEGPFADGAATFIPETIAPPEWMIRSGALATPGGPFTWTITNSDDITFTATGSGSTTGTPEAPEVVATGTVSYERETGDIVDGDNTMCFDQETGEDGQDATAVVTGTECVSPIITLCGKLTDPIIENLTTGQSLRYRGVIRAQDPCVVIDTRDGTATQGSQSRTNLLTGDTRMQLSPGDNEFRLTSFSRTDDGYATVTWRDAVIYA